MSACTWDWTHILCVPRWVCYPLGYSGFTEGNCLFVSLARCPIDGWEHEAFAITDWNSLPLAIRTQGYCQRVETTPKETPIQTSLSPLPPQSSPLLLPWTPTHLGNLDYLFLDFGTSEQTNVDSAIYKYFLNIIILCFLLTAASALKIPSASFVQTSASCPRSKGGYVPAGSPILMGGS